MALTLRATKGSELTYTEMDNNLTGLSDGSNWAATVTASSTTLAVGTLTVSTGALTGVTGSFSGNVTAASLTTNAGANGVLAVRGNYSADAASRTLIDYSTSNEGRIIVQGPNATTLPSFSINLTESDGGGLLTPLTISSAGNTTLTGTLTVNGASVALVNGSILNWNSGNVTLTHDISKLTIASITAVLELADTTAGGETIFFQSAGDQARFGINGVGTILTLNTSSGTVLAGALTASGVCDFKGAGAAFGVDVEDVGNTNNAKFVSFTANAAVCGEVTRVGTTSAVVYTTTSDRDLKNVFGDADPLLARARIMAYRMRNFEWKSSPGDLFIGPIAQEAYDVNPNPMLVKPGDGKTPWSLNMSGFIPDLIMTAQHHEVRLAALEQKLH